MFDFTNIHFVFVHNFLYTVILKKVFHGLKTWRAPNVNDWNFLNNNVPNLFSWVVQ